MDIAGWREKIDELDLQIVALISARAQAAQEIGKLKRSTTLPVYEPNRERVIFEKIRAANKGPLPDMELTATVGELVPPGTVMVKALPTKAVDTKPSGSVEGVRMVAAADQPFGLAGSFHFAKLTPREGTAPTVPPKSTLSLVAATN